MDGIQPFAGAPKPAMYSPQRAHDLEFGFGSPHHGHAAAHDVPTKTPADYLRALKRKAWLVLTIAVLVSTTGAVFVLRMPAVYKAMAEVTIEPPGYDPFLGKIISNSDDIVHAAPEDLEKYVPDKLAMLRSKALVDKVVRDPSLNGGQAVNPLDDPGADLVKNLYTRNLPNTHYWTISLDGADPAKVTRTLDLLLQEFKKKAQLESDDLIDESHRHAMKTIQQLSEELSKLNAEIYRLASTSTAIAPGGTSLPKERLAQVNQTLSMERMRYRDLERQIHLESLRPAQADLRGESRAQRIGMLEEERRMLEKRYAKALRGTRDKNDPYLNMLKAEARDIDDKIAQLSGGMRPAEMPVADDAQVILASAREEIQTLENESKRLMDQMQQSLPEYDKFMDLVAQRESKQHVMAETMKHLADFEAMSKTKKEPVHITVPPVEPTSPDRPKRGLYIVGFIMFGLVLGTGFAFLLEHVDHSVKVPEHLTGGLALPLLGVVPRIRRTSKIHRGGHLWTPGVPDSIEADAYRNVRASLLGVAGSHGPIVTLLVTSAKAGEGKSTTALNLAATCARAGERTLLVDVDLRRPSLANVFPHSDEHLGLVDVLRGDLPWQRVVVASDLPNLDFIPTGDTRDVPIEILGSLELKQLLLSLSQHHYDRVILDGPAILGLADCRMLGRIVDAAVMVVRSGTMELRPLRRAKAMLEQSQVKLAGVVFNGLSDDLDNWSSYGPSPVQVELTASQARAIAAESV